MPRAVESFSERIKKRYRLWWGPVRSYGVDGWKERLHRHQEHFTYRDQSDPEPAWRCCKFWQRTLANKWNAHHFVQGRRCRVANLCWTGRWTGNLPFGSLPDHYVIRPCYGHSRRNVLAISAGVDLLRGTPYSRDELRQHLIKTMGRFSRVPLLVHEFERTEQGEYKVPIEYKCHVFGGVIGAIQVLEKRVGQHSKSLFYGPSWEPIRDNMTETMPRGRYMDPPRCLDDILTTASTLGKAYGSYVRVDLFATDRGCVFCEFTGTPARGHTFTAYANDYFGSLWDEHVGDEI